MVVKMLFNLLSIFITFLHVIQTSDESNTMSIQPHEKQ